jgi:hypothetical protein
MVVRLGGAVLVSIVPFALSHASSSMTEFLLWFGVCGLLGGLVGGYGAIPAAIAGYAIAISYLEHTGFVGGGGDGDLYYIAAIAGSACYCIAAAIAEVLRRRDFLPSFWWRERPRDD